MGKTEIQRRLFFLCLAMVQTSLFWNKNKNAKVQVQHNFCKCVGLAWAQVVYRFLISFEELPPCHACGLLYWFTPKEGVDYTRAVLDTCLARRVQPQRKVRTPEPASVLFKGQKSRAFQGTEKPQQTFQGTEKPFFRGRNAPKKSTPHACS